MSRIRPVGDDVNHSAKSEGSGASRPAGDSAPSADAESQGAGDANALTDADLLAQLAEALDTGGALVCIGNELRGDDAAGVEIARQLGHELPWTVFDVRNAPESFLMKIVRARPACVLIVDAVPFGAAPGTIRLFDPDAVTGQGPSTHGPAPQMFLHALRMMHTCRRGVLGIQPQRTDTGAPLSAPVARAVHRVVHALHVLARRIAES